MKPVLKKIAGGLGGTLVLGYVGICAFMYASQEELIFHPTAHAEQMATLCASEQSEAFDLERDEAELHGALIVADVDAPAPVLMYFGGNAEAVDGRAEDYAWMRQAGVHLLLLPYRGYDGCSGSPSADGLRADALAAYDRIAAHPKVDPTKIYALGYSLGSGVATHLAHERELAGLMLAAPFRRLGEIAEGSYPWLPVASLIEHDFDSLGYAPDIRTPLVVVHGDADTLIPMDHGKSLVDAWGGPARLVPLKGQGHNGSSTHADAQQALREMLGAQPKPSANPS